MSPIEANNNTIRILIKLFVIKIVAKSFFGFSNSSTTKLSPLASWFNLSISVWDREKKATSVPEINAEQNNKKSTKRRLKIDTISIDKKVWKTRSGSESNGLD